MADAGTFLQIFPEFTPQSAQVPFWLNLGITKMSSSLLGGLYDYAVYLFTAHSLALRAQEAQAYAKGKLPGNTAQGPVSSKGADSLSISYDTGAVTTDDAGIYNATSYGRMLVLLLEEAAVGRVLFAAKPLRPHVMFGRVGRL